MKGNNPSSFRLFLLIFSSLGLFCLMPGSAAAAYTVTPSTWNILGLDSNTPAFGPNRFPVGAKVCGGTSGANETATFTWDAGGTETNDTNIKLRPLIGGDQVVITFGADGCTDAFFEVEVTQVATAFDKTRRYHITVGGVSTPTPRELYVERLISQSRNSITDVILDGVSIPPGGSMNLLVGNTYTIELVGGTATQGYNQFEAFINMPNTIFQILSVSTDYSANDSPYVASNNHEYLYADACLWEDDPNSPNYLSCVGGDYKAGGSNVSTTYVVKILSGGGSYQTLNTLLYDFSGSSFHYNADYSTSARVGIIIDPTSVTISKSFGPNPTNVDGISALTFTLTNPNGGAISGLNFTDVFPTSPGAMVVADPTNATTNGCGAPTFAPVAGAASISFSGGTIAAYSSCTVKVNVTPPAAGDYVNTTSNLFDGTTDTGDNASDTLTADTTSFPTPAPPAACNSPFELARWSIDGTVAPPTYTSKDADVSSATASFTDAAGFTNAIDTGQGGVAANSWYGTGWSSSSGSVTSATSPYFQFDIDTSNYGGARIAFNFALLGSGDWAAGNNNHVYVYSSADGGAYSGALTTGTASKGSWQTGASGIAANAAATGDTTSFRINADTRNSKKTAAAAYIDDIVISGCARPEPPTITKAFSPNPVAVGSTSTLTFTITNPNTDTHANYNYTGLIFTDTFPSGLTVASPLTTTNTCGGSLLDDSAGALIAGDPGISLSGGTLNSNSSCTVSVEVVVANNSPGPHDNVTDFVEATQGGANTTPTGIATASLTAVSPPSIAKQFGTNPILEGGISTLTFTITNPNQNDALSGVAFLDALPVAPDSMVVAATPNFTSSGCGVGAFSPVLVGGESAINFTGATIVAAGTCTVTVDVTAPTAGTYLNTSGNVSHLINAVTANGNTATDSLLVNPANPTISLLKQVGTSAIGPWTTFLALSTGTDVYYKFTVENTGDVPFSPVSLSDPQVNVAPCVWPAVLPVAVAANDDHLATCVVGPVTAAAGEHVNTATTTGTYGGNPYTDSSSATYATTGVTLVKSAAESSFTVAADTLNYSYVVSNTGAAPLVGPVTVADDKATVTCLAVSTATGGPADGDNYLDPGEQITCTASYTVLAADVTAKSVTNVASATLNGVTSPTDTVTVPLASDLTAVKTNSVDGSLTLGGSFVWILTVSNSTSAGSPATFANAQVILTDDLPTSGATYLVGSVKKAGTTGTIDCVIASKVLTCTANGAVSIPAVIPVATLSVTNNDAAVVGSGTAFTTQYAAGSSIAIVGVPYTISTITDDTHLTLMTNYAGATAPGLAIPGSFNVPVTVTTTAQGDLVNPQGGGVCKADPTPVLPEIDETNNDCTDTVTVQVPSLMILKYVQVHSDSVNATNPKALPGAFMDYFIVVTNSGLGTVDSNSMIITDPIPTNTELFVGDIDGAASVSTSPVLFTDGANASGLTYTFSNTGDPAADLNAADDLSFSGNNGTDYTKGDVAADANECDSTVTDLKVSLGGTFAASDGTNHPSFSLKFRVRVK